MQRRSVILLTAIAPVLWGTTWIGTTEYMPADRPMLTALLRALPTGLLLLAFVRRLPSGAWWWRAAVLGALNFTIFFALLSVAAFRVPGGVAATMGALQPLMVLALGVPLLALVPGRRQVLAGLVGIVGVGLLVFDPSAELDLIGILAAIGGVASMAVGMVLTKRWADPDVDPLTTTAWQLVAAGVMLLPLTLAVEGTPPAPTSDTWIAIAWVGLLGTGIGNWLWFVGLARLEPAQASFLSLIAPVTAATIGWVVLEEALSPVQLLGGLVALGSVVAGQAARGSVAGPTGRA